MAGSRATHIFKMLTAILLTLNDDKNTETHRAVDKNMLFQDSVNLFSTLRAEALRSS